MDARMVKVHQQSTLAVLTNGDLVGQLERDRSGLLSFSYDQGWLSRPGARPLSLSMPLIDQAYSGAIVYNFFDNLLPDNPQVRARIQTRFQTLTDQPFDLLSQIGRDCVGAIQICPQEASNFKHEIAAQPISDQEIAKLLQDYRKAPLGLSDKFEHFRISIAGAQEKTALLFHKNKWNIPEGQTPSTHIFKLPIGVIQHQNIDLSESCENEWLCAQIAMAFGLSAAPCEIKMFGDVKVLVVERFDRKLSSDKKWIMRLPQEDMCQALGISSNLKYQSDGGPGIADIMKLLIGSIEPHHDRREFYRAQVLFWLLAAIDGHAKNFSVFIEAQGRYRLTPLYDIISTYPLMHKKQLHARKIKMAMALQGTNKHYHWHEAQGRHFIETAKHVGFGTKEARIDLEAMLAQVDSVIDKVTAMLPTNFPSHIAEPIFEGMQKMKAKLEKTILTN